MTRQVRDLQWVRALPGRPSCIPESRPRGAKRDGVTYESALAGLPEFAAAQHGLWLEFCDASGHGYAQVDFALDLGGFVVVAEAKLTWRTQAYTQLRGLYLPLMRALTHNPVGGIVVCRNVTRATPRSEVTQDLAEAIGLVRRDPTRVPVVHLRAGADEAPRRPVKAPKPPLPKWWNKGTAKPPAILLGT